MKVSQKGYILVVDDEETMRRSLADILRLEGYQVQVAPNGEAALVLIRKESFDLILLDLKMPGIDGLEVLQFVSKTVPDTEVILLTAHGSLESAIEALRLEAHDYLLKPASPKQILASVSSALVRRAELQRKRMLLDKLDNSLRELRRVDKGEKPSSVEEDAISLGSGIWANLLRREIWMDNLSESKSSGKKISLTPAEGKLLQVMLENRGKVMSHRDLVMKVQGYDVTEWEAPEVLRPLVSRLRHKLSAFPGADLWIQSVRGTGYVLELNVEW
jgi:DNA-binding response OmpR family regulator